MDLRNETQLGVTDCEPSDSGQADIDPPATQPVCTACPTGANCLPAVASYKGLCCTLGKDSTPGLFFAREPCGPHAEDLAMIQPITSKLCDRESKAIANCLACSLSVAPRQGLTRPTSDREGSVMQNIEPPNQVVEDAVQRLMFIHIVLSNREEKPPGRTCKLWSPQGSIQEDRQHLLGLAVSLLPELNGVTE